MIGNWLARRKASNAGPAASGPPGTLVWTQGAIHGRLDILRPMLSAGLVDFARSAQTRKVLVFLGDYVDRGPESQGVIELLCRLADGGPVEAIFLRGNHEDRMAAFLEDPGIGPTWCDYGGREALRSYGVTAPADRADKEAWATASADFNAAVSDRHRAFLRDLKFSVSIGDYFFVHAGARPGVPLDQQSRHDMMWIRQSFLDDSRTFEKIIVHGHTPTDDIQSDHRRIGLDTGAYATGVLTAVRLEGEERAALQTAMTGSGVELWRSEVETAKGAKRSVR
jgi:serine/threonine protein phosphatase 1